MVHRNRVASVLYIVEALLKKSLPKDYRIMCCLLPATSENDKGEESRYRRAKAI
jgi:hypothetical protein